MRGGFLSRVIVNRLREGTGIGIVAAAATAGTLMGFGHARGATLQPLNAVAHMYAGSRAVMITGFQPDVTLGAIAIHLLSMIIWGLVLAYAARGLRGVPRALAPVGVAVLAYLLDRFVAPERLRPGFAELLSAGEVIFVYVVLGAALAAGLWAMRRTPARD
jgi:hypothetical protein